MTTNTITKYIILYYIRVSMSILSCGAYKYKIELYPNDNQQDLEDMEGPVNNIYNVCVVTLTIHNITLFKNDSLV